MSCVEQYRAMAFAQLTYRESLRDIETCLSVQAAKLYSMGFGDPVRRSTLADANEARDWRIYAELAQRLIAQARRLYTNEDLGFDLVNDLANTVYALDSTTIDLCATSRCDRNIEMSLSTVQAPSAKCRGILETRAFSLSLTIAKRTIMNEGGCQKQRRGCNCRSIFGAPVSRPNR